VKNREYDTQKMPGMKNPGPSAKKSIISSGSVKLSVVLGFDFCLSKLGS